VAHEYGDQLTDAEAAQALSLYATHITDDLETPHTVPARRRYEIRGRHTGLCAGRWRGRPGPGLTSQPYRQPEAGA
jgi:hypothetical protein